ncbi:hypothetical protein PVAP13_9NG331365 [Panicum virgatum]|uniref:Uncharacterized protein n=1 Tax=Panicum virgatum TaxID=38727 RepID=A0A8T0MLG6_PANVG|nr:hypothetical protein PVAP13_9NG331365 [Panicum virgatum]
MYGLSMPMQSSGEALPHQHRGTGSRLTTEVVQRNNIYIGSTLLTRVYMQHL